MGEKSGDKSPHCKLMTLPADTHLGHYEIRSKIGAGGMGEVYLPQDTKLDRKVASPCARLEATQVPLPFSTHSTSGVGPRAKRRRGFNAWPSRLARIC